MDCGLYERLCVLPGLLEEENAERKDESQRYDVTACQHCGVIGCDCVSDSTLIRK